VEAAHQLALEGLVAIQTYAIDITVGLTQVAARIELHPEVVIPSGRAAGAERPTPGLTVVHHRLGVITERVSYLVAQAHAIGAEIPEELVLAQLDAAIEALSPVVGEGAVLAQMHGHSAPEELPLLAPRLVALTDRLVGLLAACRPLVDGGRGGGWPDELVNAMTELAHRVEAVRTPAEGALWRESMDQVGVALGGVSTALDTMVCACRDASGASPGGVGSEATQVIASGDASPAGHWSPQASASGLKFVTHEGGRRLGVA
jgi:hypothetical protein